jgi:DNA-binding CsgD family transcriptional regulator
MREQVVTYGSMSWSMQVMPVGDALLRSARPDYLEKVGPLHPFMRRWDGAVNLLESVAEGSNVFAAEYPPMDLHNLRACLGAKTLPQAMDTAIRCQYIAVRDRRSERPAISPATEGLVHLIGEKGLTEPTAARRFGKSAWSSVAGAAYRELGCAPNLIGAIRAGHELGILEGSSMPLLRMGFALPPGKTWRALSQEARVMIGYASVGKTAEQVHAITGMKPTAVQDSWRRVYRRTGSSGAPQAIAKLAVSGDLAIETHSEGKVEPRLGPVGLLVATLLAQGYNNKEIGKQLHIAESTVKTHLRSLQSKMESNYTRGHLIRRLFEVGLFFRMP